MEIEAERRPRRPNSTGAKVLSIDPFHQMAVHVFNAFA